MSRPLRIEFPEFNNEHICDADINKLEETVALNKTQSYEAVR